MPRWEYRFKRAVIDFLLVMVAVLAFTMTVVVTYTPNKAHATGINRLH